MSVAEQDPVDGQAELELDTICYIEPVQVGVQKL